MSLLVHTTHILQPLHVVVFKEIKAKYIPNCDHSGIKDNEMVTRSSFPKVWSNAIQDGATDTSVVAVGDGNMARTKDPDRDSDTKGRESHLQRIAALNRRLGAKVCADMY